MANICLKDRIANMSDTSDVTSFGIQFSKNVSHSASSESENEQNDSAKKIVQIESAENFEPQRHWDLVAFEGKKVLVYVMEDGNNASASSKSIGKIIRKTVTKGINSGGDFVVPITIGKTTW